MNTKQEIQQLFNVADSYDKFSYRGKREINNDIYDILRKCNPNADTHKLSLMALKLSYIYVHNYTDDRSRQFEQTKKIISK